MIDNKKFYHDLDKDKIQINWNKNPIQMVKFLSFLTVETIRTNDRLGSGNGWTLFENKDLKLKIGGGIVGGVEYLDTIEYGVKLANSYNNYVNPFYLFEIMNEDGKKFFFEYYQKEIDLLKTETIKYIKKLRKEIKEEIDLLDQIKLECQGYIRM